MSVIQTRSIDIVRGSLSFALVGVFLAVVTYTTLSLLTTASSIFNSYNKSDGLAYLMGVSLVITISSLTANLYDGKEETTAFMASTS